MKRINHINRNIPTNSIAFAHFKGGTGKTTSCLNIAGWLSKMNQRVLVIDLDPQANSTSGLGIEIRSVKHSINDVFLNKASISNIILESRSGVYVAPSSPELLFIESQLIRIPQLQKITALKIKINEIRDYFNFILIDCPPTSSFLMMNGIIATQNVIIPLDVGVFGFETIDLLLSFIWYLEQETKLPINILMTLFRKNQYSLINNPINYQIKENILKSYEGNNIKNSEIHSISYSKKILQAQMSGLPISHFAPNSKVSKQFKKITLKILSYQN